MHREVPGHGFFSESADGCSDRDTLFAWFLFDPNWLDSLTPFALEHHMRLVPHFPRRTFACAAAFALFIINPLGTLPQDPAKQETHGIVVAYMDRSVKPGDDFYHYANGDWIKRAEIPADTGYVAVDGFMPDDYSNELSRKRSADLIQEAIKANAPAGSTLRKIADLYRSYSPTGRRYLPFQECVYSCEKRSESARRWPSSRKSFSTTPYSDD